MPPLWLTFVIFIPLASLELRLRATIRTSLRFPVNSVCDSATYDAIRGRETEQAVRWCCRPSLPSTALGPGTWDGGQEGRCSKESHLQPQRQGPKGPPLCLHKITGIFLSATVSRRQGRVWRGPGAVPPPPSKLGPSGLGRRCSGHGWQPQGQRGILRHFHGVTFPT